MVGAFDIFIYSGSATIILFLINFYFMSYSCGECGNRKCLIGWWNKFAPLLLLINFALLIVTIGAGLVIISGVK